MKVIELKQITVSHNRVELLKRLDLTVSAGQITGIIGGPGSGKTTLLQLLSGNRKPANGRGTILGNDIYSLQTNAGKVRIGYIPASLGIDNELTVGETMQIFSSLYNGNSNQEDLVLDALRVIDMEFYTEFTVSRLSSRQKLFLAIGISLLHSPQILLIDEPAPYLEAGGRLEFLQLLRQIADQGTAVVIATRSVPDGSYCDEVAILHGGKLSISGSVDTLCQSFDVTCFEVHIAERIEEKLVQALEHTGLVSYLSGRTIRVVNPVDSGEELQQYGFYKTRPGLEDVKRLYESVAGLQC
jgi:ABC-type multidrug transport system ATPase subunit